MKLTIVCTNLSLFREPLEDLNPLVPRPLWILYKFGERELRHPQLKRMFEGLLTIRRRSVT